MLPAAKYLPGGIALIVFRGSEMQLNSLRKNSNRGRALMHIALLKNTVQKYAWGSKTAIPELLGQTPDGDPQAELWMGAHPKAPSEVDIDGRLISLAELIDKQPESILGKTPARKFGNKLPFLLKVLAAAAPLSIQAHPDRKQAREGFLRETAAGISLGAGNRNYRDSNHKPECICALTPFWALNGFRKTEEIRSYLNRLCPDTLSDELARLSHQQTPHGLKRFFQKLMTLPADEVLFIVKEAVTRAKAFDDPDPVLRWIIKLHDSYPKDIGILSPAILNLVLLNPGEAMYLSAGRLHAYFEGLGIELMANSDNVLRGGLTNKHIDVPELLNALCFEETVPEILTPMQQGPCVRIYRTPVEEFLLSELSVSGDAFYLSPVDRSIEILLCVEGTANILEIPSNRETAISKGVSLMIPAMVDRYRIEGDAVFYRASVGGRLDKNLDI